MIDSQSMKKVRIQPESEENGSYRVSVKLFVSKCSYSSYILPVQVWFCQSRLKNSLLTSLFDFVSYYFLWMLTRFLQYCLQTCIWKFWQNEKFCLAVNPPFSFFSGKFGGRKHRWDFFLKHCPLHPAEACNGFLASDWLYSLWNDIKLAIDATR